jgi:hypothetical protein
VEEPVAEEALRRLLTAAGPAAGVRTGATPPPVALLRRAGARFVSVDAALLASMPDDDLGEALESGIGLLVAAMPLGRPTHPRVAAQPLRRLWQRLGLNLEELARAVAVTPDDGLEQLSPEAAGSALRQTAELARFLEEKAMEES